MLKAERLDEVQHQCLVRTECTLHENGSLNAVTRLSCGRKVVGFHAEVFIVVRGEGDAVVWSTGVKHRYGIDGSLPWGRTRTRTETWSESMPAALVPKAVRLEVHQWDSPDDIGSIVPRAVRVIRASLGS